MREGGGQPELCMISSLDSILHISILPSFGETFNFSHRNNASSEIKDYQNIIRDYHYFIFTWEKCSLSIW